MSVVKLKCYIFMLNRKLVRDKAAHFKRGQELHLNPRKELWVPDCLEPVGKQKVFITE